MNLRELIGRDIASLERDMASLKRRIETLRLIHDQGDVTADTSVPAVAAEAVADAATIRARLCEIGLQVSQAQAGGTST